MDEAVGDWVLKSLIDGSEDKTKVNQYAVVGEAEGAAKEDSFLPPVVGRFPWEGFEEIGFRSVKKAADSDSMG